jgi:hypothetical protein
MARRSQAHDTLGWNHGQKAARLYFETKLGMHSPK